ncbi:hypothetical protein [uncultured Campylobacter sp.]|uniref:hypothetical protein n=1 Tax=uncultured Campylobacter sp. TaxID=218934 RepID=UPI00262738CE|nr:hypothetical protein [uncultured Campylobacter sp.]
MILCFEFSCASDGLVLAFFLDFWAKKSALKYSITAQNGSIKLYVEGDENELARFSDEYINLVPHSIFIEESKVSLADKLPQNSEFEFNFSFKNITPNALQIDENEFGFKSDSSFINSAIKDIIAGKTINYDGYELSKFSGFDGDYLLPTNLKNATKIFVCDEKSLIALASFEKPIMSLRTNAIYRSNHKNAPLYFDIRSAWDINIYKITQALSENGINFVSVKSSKNDMKISILDERILIIKAGEFIRAKEREFINSFDDKNYALFGLCVNELGVSNSTIARVFLSQKYSDFIKVYKGDDEFNMLRINLPKSFDEIWQKISEFDGGDRLLANYQKEYTLPKGSIDLPDNFYSLFMIIDKILGYNGKILNYARDYSGLKGVRIDYKMSSKSEFDWVRAIRSTMSFRLAGADAKNISFGCLESLAFFLSDFGDILKDELECEGMIFSGNLFANPVIANLALKFCNSNYKSKFSGRYPLEID